MNLSFIDQLNRELNNESGTPLANTLNVLSMIKQTIGEGAWVGLYIYDESIKALRLGPFQGKEACLLIKPKRGLVGLCFSRNEEIYAPNVNELTNYISCDPLTLSEFVFPLRKDNGDVFAVFDIDSPKIDGLSDFLPFLKECAKTLNSAPYLEKFVF